MALMFGELIQHYDLFVCLVIAAAAQHGFGGFNSVSIPHTATGSMKTKMTFHPALDSHQRDALFHGHNASGYDGSSALQQPHVSNDGAEFDFKLRAQQPARACRQSSRKRGQSGADWVDPRRDAGAQPPDT